MPTYEYECTQCSHRFEEFQSMKAKPIEICPVCKGTVRRLIGKGAGIIFKGSGFYQTDYRSSSYQKKAEAEKSPVKKTDKPEGKKPESDKKSDSNQKTDSTLTPPPSSNSQSQK